AAYHLDGHHEPAPLLLDEALVNWDAHRRAGLYRGLTDAPTARQVVLFTCHEHLADEATQALDGLRIDL
ncbi:MAG: hypothetical protein AAGA20_23420, partial [Planctomycetota bacterium]